ncbi:carbohydrate-binding protein [Trueperella sp. HMSC08H06]|uniref:carbohydrate-binding protein n=1 Tax=Trueperella sp. HMSC08H06 TaxID=1581142 RepID=UPI0008A1F1FF|nr:carbohydrate-binding protein [Trueperella sp. HMSC08H06]OFS67509.1 hypothetical protein HMPREF3174_03530 [Trueperella sp. HMSC08H06]
MDVAELSDSELAQLANAVRVEQDRRQNEALVEKQIIEAVKKIQLEDGTRPRPARPYVQPVGAHDAYTRGDTVVWDGGLWESQLAVNVWPPQSVAGAWERIGVAPTNEPDGEREGAPEWVPGLAMVAGDLVSYQGSVYRVVQAHTAQVGWEPQAVPALFSKI